MLVHHDKTYMCTKSVFTDLNPCIVYFCIDLCPMKFQNTAF